jgi:hypothetical protein
MATKLGLYAHKAYTLHRAERRLINKKQMKFNFRKISAIATSVLMTGMTMAGAAAASYPAPFVSGSNADVAIVYGANAAQTDLTAATNIQTNLASKLTTTTTVTAEGGVTEDEIVLRADVNGFGEYATALTDSDIPGLLDTKINWDDGTGSEDYDVHEEIIINGDLQVRTTLDDDEFDESVALTADEGALEYRYVFEDALNYTLVGDDDADDLFLTILGQEYEITNMEATSITVVTSKEVALSIGGSYTDSATGTTIIVDDVFDGSAQINGEIISEGNTKTINGVKVEVDSVGYHSNSPETSKVILKIGEEISESFDDGDAYIGEDDDNPEWEWNIVGLDAANGYIGVLFAGDHVDADEDPMYMGESYMLPEDFASVTLVGLTDVTYEDLTVSFDETMDVFNSTEDGDEIENQPVLVLEGENDDSLQIGSIETDAIYLRYAGNNTGIESNSTYGAIEIYYRDVDGDVGSVGDAIYENQVNLTAPGTLSKADSTLNFVNDDTTVDISFTVASGVLTVSLGDVDVVVGGDALANRSGTLEYLGEDLEDAEDDEVLMNGSSVGTKDMDLMNYDGVVIKDPESNGNNDKVVLEVPSEMVYAEVAVAGGDGITTSTSGALGNVIVMDSEVSSVASKNLVIVGGSCINSAAANVLTGGSAACGDAFTAATGVGVGEWVIKSVADAYTSGKMALVVAGYEAADTTAAATYLTTQVDDTSVSYKGTSATEGSVMVE